MGVTTPLRRALKQTFYPFVERRGFVADLRDQPRSVVFRRTAGSVVQMFEVQWEKFGKPRFALNFGTCSVDGITIQHEVHSAGSVYPSWCPDAGALQPRRGATSRSWFRQDHSFVHYLLRGPALRDPTAVVAELLALFPELEQYWSTGHVGPHMRIWKPRNPRAVHNGS